MNILKIFPFIKLEFFNEEPCFTVKTKMLDKSLFLFKNHFNYQFKILTFVTVCPNVNYLYSLRESKMLCKCIIL